MNKLRQVAAVGAIFGVLSMGSSEVSRNPADQRIEYNAVADTFTPQQRQVFENARMRLVGRWGSLAATRLVLLEGDETFTCDPPKNLPTDYKPFTVGSRAKEGPFYCPGNDAVVIEAGVVNAMTSAFVGPHVGRAAALEEFIIDHEYGHSRQAKTGQLKYAPQNATFDQLVAVGKPIELQADCFAGQEMAALNPGLLGRTVEILQMFPSEGLDPMHGGSENRVAYFDAGAAGAAC